MSKFLVPRWPAAGRMGAALGVALLAAACGSSGGSASNGGGPTASAGSASAGSTGAASASASGAAGTVIRTHSGSGGEFLTDGAGRAVYLWVADSTGKSTCSGACTAAWPPVPVTSQVSASGGAIASDLSTIIRSDGSKQIAYDGHALYYFAGDSAAAQTNGQGSDSFGAKWWLVTPSGTAITGAGSATAPAKSGY